MPRTYILSCHPAAVESLGDIALRRSDHDAARKAYLRGRSKQIGAYATLRECPMMGDGRSTPESGRRSRRRSPTMAWTKP